VPAIDTLFDPPRSSRRSCPASAPTPCSGPRGGRKTGRARARDTPACAWPRPAIWGTA